MPSLEGLGMPAHRGATASRAVMISGCLPEQARARPGASCGFTYHYASRQESCFYQLMPTCDSGILEQRMQVCLQAKMPAKAVSKAVSALSAGRGHGDGV
jgi:hypothetical protein